MTRLRGKAPTQRQLRVGEELRHVVADMIERGEMADPDLRDVPITVTEVRVSPDLREAEVLVTPFGGGDAEALLKALARAAPYFRSQVGRRVRLKYTPRLRFELDTSFEQANRVEALLRRPSVARDLVGEGGGEPQEEATRQKGSPGDE
jgi:ribosome-binding factor A